VPQNFFFEQAQPEVRELVLKATRTLASLGAVVHEVRIPSLRYLSFMDAAIVNESRTFLLPFARRGPEAFADRTIWEKVIISQFVRAADTMKAARVRNLIRKEFMETMEKVDILAMPTNICPAFPIEPKSNLTDNTTLTFPFNLVGIPAISLPCGFTSEGLPVGLMLAGRHWEDDVVLRTAYAYEQAATGGYLVPPVVKEASGQPQ